MLDPQIYRSGGEMGALVRAFDWAGTPLGPVGSWPASLRTAVSIMLTTRHPMALFWGPELIQLYNDAYRLSLGPNRHPSALGARAREVWAEIWHIVGPEMESIMAGGDATWHTDYLVPATRRDRVEDAYWSYSYSPVPNDAGGVGGVLVTMQETTHRVIAERRAQMLGELSERLNAVTSTAHVCLASADVLAGNPRDIAFALIYLPGEHGTLHLSCAVGLERGSRAAPAALSRFVDHPWPVTGVMSGSEPIFISTLAAVGPVHRELWREPVREAMLLPVGGEDPDRGVLIVGASPRLALELPYQAFFADVARIITTALIRVRHQEEERRAEVETMDAQRLQSVGRLAGGVAHEVNNNMTVVLGLGEIVLEALGPDHPEGRDLKAMLEAGARAARISQQLLTFTRQQFTQPRRLDLYAVITRLEPMLRSLVGNDKNLVIAPDQKAAPISADLPQVEQVLVALITNARDATPAGGQVTVSVDDVALSGEETVERGVLTWPGDYVRLVVSDTGAGMDSETLARVFDPFFTTKPVGVGTGLGLSMVYGVVKRHEGYIGVDSAPGQGTTLRLYWPALELDSREDSGAAPAFPQRRSGEHTTRVWVVEDEAPVRELLARTLKAEGFRVVTADNGAHALQLLHDEPDAPDIVITDLVMPVVNGRQVSEAVATRYPDVPVLFMSGYSVDEVVRLGLLSARAAFLQKPFTPTQLVDALEAMLAPAG